MRSGERHGDTRFADIQTLDVDGMLGLLAPIEIGVCFCEALCVCDVEDRSEAT